MEASHIIAHEIEGRGTGWAEGMLTNPSQESCPMACSSGIWQQLCNLLPPVLRNGARELDVKVDDHVPFLARLLGDGHPLQEAAEGVADHSLHGDQAASHGACAASITSFRLLLQPGVAGSSRTPQYKQLLALGIPSRMQPFARQPFS